MTREQVITEAIREWLCIDPYVEDGPGPFLINELGEEFNVDGFFYPAKLAAFIEDRLQRAGFK